MVALLGGAKVEEMMGKPRLKPKVKELGICGYRARSPVSVRSRPQTAALSGVTALELLRQRAFVSAVSRASATGTFMAVGVVEVAAIRLLPEEANDIVVRVAELIVFVAFGAGSRRAVPENC
jgi:hypothetical protein